MMNKLQFAITTTFQEHPFALVFLTLLTWLAQSYYHSKARKLKDFPAVGSTLPLLSLLGAFNYVKSVPDVIQDGIRKYPGRNFKIRTPTDWWVILTNFKHIGEVAKAPEHVWSALKVIDELFQFRFIIGPQINNNPYHIPIVKNQLTKAIPQLVPDLHDEIISSFNELLPPGEVRTSIKLYEHMVKLIARVSNRAVVGAPLCRNMEWLDLNIEVSKDVVQTAFLLSFFPPILRPAVISLISRVHRQHADALRLLGPTIAARRIERENKLAENPSDFLTWFMDEAKGEEQQNHFLISRILVMNFATIHTTSSTTTQALFDLASFPEYVEPLREEIETTIKQEGWTKDALDKMHKLDSFIKESQRLHPVGTFTLLRIAVNDYTFSDGTTIPAGTIVAASTPTIHQDSDNYEDPLKFDGFRFVKLKECATLEGQPDKKFDMVSTSLTSLAFSHGRHGCPGRFFAATEIKLILAHVIMTYDIKLTSGVRPVDQFLMHHIMPDPSAELLFTRR